MQSDISYWDCIRRKRHRKESMRKQSRLRKYLTVAPGGAIFIALSARTRKPYRITQLPRYDRRCDNAAQLPIP